MNIQKGIILTSIGGYLSCIIMTLIKKPPLEGIPPTIQLLMYLFITIILWELQRRPPQTTKTTRTIFTIIYGAAAMLSFSGIIPWINYQGPENIGPFMMIWDILLGTAIYTLL